MPKKTQPNKEIKKGSKRVLNTSFRYKKYIILNDIYSNDRLDKCCLLKRVGQDLKSDKQVVLAAVERDGFALEFAHVNLKNDKEVVLAAVKNAGYALRYASARLKKDKEIILAAVERDGLVLQYASHALSNDKKVVLAAVKQDGLSLQFAHADLKQDKEFILDVLKVNADAMVWIDEHLKTNPNFILKAVKSNGDVLQHLSPEMKKLIEKRLAEEVSIDSYIQLTLDKSSKPNSPNGWFSDQAPEWEQRLAEQGCSFLSLTDQV